MTDLPSQFEEILDYTDGIYMTIDPDWIIRYSNQVSLKLLNLPADQLVNTDIRESLPDVISVFYKTLNNTLKHQKPGRVSKLYGPTQKTLELRTNPTDYGMLIILHDITLREERMKSLYDSETQHRAILETLTDALIIIDEQGLITSFNHAAEKMFGYEDKQVMGLNVSILLPEDERKTHEDYTAYSDLHKSRIIDRFRELKGMRRDGSVFPIELNVSPLNMGGHFGFVGIIRDVTERKIAQDKILQGKLKAEKANEAKSEFLASMSHELRTPLNAIMGYSQLLEMEPKLEQHYKEQVFEIHKAGKLLLDLVEDVLNFTKIDAGKFEIVAEEFSLEELLVECLEVLTPLSEQLNVNVQLSPACCRFQLNADRVRLRQVIVNLLSNAIKYNCENGKVEINCEDDKKNWLRISIFDTGPGIESERIDELFEPFNRLGKEGSNIQGTGIGLSISKQLIEAMNGRIGVESTAGEGSQFWIQLPLSYNEVKVEH